MQRNNLLSDKQGGFRKGFSTASSIGDLTDNLLNIINQGLTTLVVFVDLKKVFDTVDHTILLKKLELSGVRGTNLEWCNSYLSRRQQWTFAGEAVVECGVPHGSVLGPTFFILYVNDMQNGFHYAQIQLYADDTMLHVCGVSAVEAAGWCMSNKLTLNVSKTKLMAFGMRNKVKKQNNPSFMRKVNSCKWCQPINTWVSHLIPHSRSNTMLAM